MEVAGFTVEGGGSNSEDNIREFLKTQKIEGVSVDIEPVENPDWDLPYETIYFNSDNNPNVKFSVTFVTIDVDDWLELQQEVHGSDSEENFRRGATERTVERVAEDINQGETGDIPMPVLEIKPDGAVRYDEGRSRGYGAKEAGVDRIPILIAAQDYR